ncbi:hypothetical protein [Planctomycetes bacterium TBK1r]|uniref:Uncharacterized protein n=1 Tax=Stieleria magnilauensis TaxID=2527963 RepID=A0ABX5XY80_9BACT|nr:hypothetical protein TBK1r_59340 [Planctomycetes bacterium TBK1r]QDV86985.1 hypothetical protein TBK1r_60120 [Planctomycetes bacterium TBK1r]
MRPAREITDAEDNWRTVPLIEGDPRFVTSRRDFVDPEPVGSIVLIPFRVTGYDRDCDGSAMARLEAIDKDGGATGWTESHIGLFPDSTLVTSPGELLQLFENPPTESPDRVQ